MTPSEQPFTIILDDDEANVAEGKLPGADAGPTWAKHRVTVELDEGDTSGHSMDAKAVSITLHFDDDVEGHALSLQFPSAAKADEFRKRLLVTGVVAGALVVGVTAAQFSGTIPATSAGPIAAPVPISQPLVNPRIPAEDLAAPVSAPSVAQPRREPADPGRGPRPGRLGRAVDRGAAREPEHPGRGSGPRGRSRGRTGDPAALVAHPEHGSRRRPEAAPGSHHTR